ncbi:MAG: hypothetical protein FJ026_16690 [Chloroflexi bacterium]|nr:hypothetical protein [Chloroflexota bacterium]
MVSEVRPLVEITREALQVLYREIGIVNTVRFLNQFSTGFGDCTEERRELFANMTLDDLVAEIRRRKSQPSSAQ